MGRSPREKARSGLHRLIVVLILAASTGVAWAVWPRNHLLLKIATPVPGSDSVLRDREREYRWLSSYEVLVQAGPPMPGCFGTLQPNAPGFHSRLIDCRTGRQTLLTSLDARLNYHKPSWRFPPRVLIGGESRLAIIDERRPDRLEIVNVDTGKFERGTTLDYGRILIHPDGRRLFLVDWNEAAIDIDVYALEKPEQRLNAYHVSISSDLRLDPLNPGS